MQMSNSMLAQQGSMVSPPASLPPSGRRPITAASALHQVRSLLIAFARLGTAVLTVMCSKV